MAKNKNKHRFHQIIRVLLRYRRGKFTPLKLKLILEDLGPTYVKIGQLMSMRTDMLPSEYCKVLEDLRENVKPIEFKDMLPQIEQELKRPIEEVFIEFDPVPIGAASIAQAYLAKLYSGEEVVVKVQRPGIYEMMEMDIKLLKRAVVLLKLITKVNEVVDLNMVLEEVWSTTKKELDFTVEANNAKKLRENNANINYIGVPLIYDDLSTPRLLTMEYIGGYKIDETDELLAGEYDLKEITTKLLENYVKQIVEDGFFHADPHPGNIKIRDGKIYWLDFGMMGTLSYRDKEVYKKAIKAIANKDVNSIKTCILILGKYDEIDHTKLYVDIEMMIQKYFIVSLSELNLGSMLEEFIALANSNGIKMPPDMTMFCRGIMTIEGVVMKLEPSINIATIFGNFVASSQIKDIDTKQTVQEFARIISMSFKNTLEIPSLLKDVLDIALRGQMKVVVDNKISKDAIADISKLLINFTLGLFIIGLLWAATAIMLSDKNFYSILGIPLMCYLLYFIDFVLIIVFSVRCFKKK